MGVKYTSKFNEENVRFLLFLNAYSSIVLLFPVIDNASAIANTLSNHSNSRLKPDNLIIFLSSKSSIGDLSMTSFGSGMYTTDKDWSVIDFTYTIIDFTPYYLQDFTPEWNFVSLPVLSITTITEIAQLSATASYNLVDAKDGSTHFWPLYASASPSYRIAL